MKNVIYKNKILLSAIVFVLIFCTVFLTVQDVARIVYADSSVSFDDTNVLDDLMSSTINGKDFDIADYPFDESKDLEVIFFVEYCYSYRVNLRDNYGLYIYVYNPKGVNIAVNSYSNKIQMATSYNSDGEPSGYTKFNLEFCSRVEDGNYKNLFYKFKVVDCEVNGKTFAERVNSNARRYDVSGVELLTTGETTVVETLVGSTFVYSGYAKGYGPDMDAESTLTCSSESLETVSLDVKSTYYRPNGTNGGKYVRDTLHSVYFSVPNELIEKYGDMTAVHACWLNAKTNPIFVTGNSTVYNAISQYIGQYVDGGNYQLVKDANANTSLKYSLIASKYIESANFNNISRSSSYMSYNINGKYTSDSDVTLNYLQYCFPVDNMDETDSADTYIVSAESLLGDEKNNKKGYFQEYTEKYGGTLVNDKFSSALFEDVDDEFTDITIKSTDTFTLTDEIISQDLWQKFIGGGYNVTGTNTYNLSAIKRVEDSDFKALPSDTCSNLYIDESDYVEFLAFYTEAKIKDETVYLFRYFQSDYTHYEVAEYERTSDGALIECFDYEFIDTNAYFMQMYVQLDFDVIDVSFTKGVKTVVIPNVMSPIDISADGGDTLLPNSDDDELPDWVRYLFMLLGLILFVVLCYPIIPYIIQAFMWIIKMLFKFIKMIFKGIGNMFDSIKQHNRERKEKSKTDKSKDKSSKRVKKKGGTKDKEVKT